MSLRVCQSFGQEFRILFSCFLFLPYVRDCRIKKFLSRRRSAETVTAFITVSLLLCAVCVSTSTVIKSQRSFQSNRKTFEAFMITKTCDEKSFPICRFQSFDFIRKLLLPTWNVLQIFKIFKIKRRRNVSRLNNLNSLMSSSKTFYYH